MQNDSDMHTILIQLNHSLWLQDKPFKESKSVRLINPWSKIYAISSICILSNQVFGVEVFFKAAK